VIRSVRCTTAQVSPVSVGLRCNDSRPANYLWSVRNNTLDVDALQLPEPRMPLLSVLPQWSRHFRFAVRKFAASNWLVVADYGHRRLSLVLPAFDVVLRDISGRYFAVILVEQQRLDTVETRNVVQLNSASVPASTLTDRSRCCSANY
jgi:hypothetical protein